MSGRDDRRRPGDNRRAGQTGQPKAMSDLLGSVLAENNIDLAAPSAAIGDNWEALVGAEVAAHCRPVGIKAGVLHSDVDSSVWCQQLQMRSPEILAALKKFLGKSAPTDLRFRVGNIGYSERPTDEDPHS